MKTRINPPSKSKINWTAGTMAVAGLLVMANVIPEDNQAEVAGALLTVGGVLVAVFRSFFTDPD